MTISTNIETLNHFYKEYVGEEKLSPFISYPERKIFYPIPVVYLRIHVNRINPKEV